MMIGMIGLGDSSVDKKLQDPNMDLHENPMFDERPCPIRHRNMRRMRDDLEARMNPAHGRIYEAFKSVRYDQRKEN